nr:MAG TPA: hypothetical protein [Caudoviricetes sp.]
MNSNILDYYRSKSVEANKVLLVNTEINLVVTF